MILPDEIEICRYAMDLEAAIICPPEACGNFHDGQCHIDGKKCETEIYERKREEKK